jgi:hypothetical protein
MPREFDVFSGSPICHHGPFPQGGIMTAPIQFGLCVSTKYHDMGHALPLSKFVPAIEQVGRSRNEIIDPPRHGRAAPARIKTVV